MKRLSLTLVLALIVACSGRSNNDNGGTDTGNQGKDVIQVDLGNGGSEINNGTDIGDTSGTKISELQGSDSSLNCSTDGFQAIQQGLDMAPVVVVSPQFVASKDKSTGDPKLYGYFVAQAGVSPTQPLNGIEITVDPAVDPGLKEGDLLSIQGDYVEFYCNSELKVKAVTVKGQAQEPAPLDITPDVFDDPQKLEKLEGVLVRLKNVTVTDANPDSPKDYGNFQVAGKVRVANKFKVSYMNKDTDARANGDVFAELIGIVDYSYGKYSICPRSDADLTISSKSEGTQKPESGTQPDAGGGTPTATTVQAIQSGSDSTTCANPSGNNKLTKNNAFSGLVVISPKFVASSKSHLNGYFVCDGGATQIKDYSCIDMVVKENLDPGLNPGDTIDLTADYSEYYCNSELFATAITKSGTASVPAAKVITVADYSDSTDSTKWEPLEGLLVTLKGVKITNAKVLGSDNKDHGDFMVGGDGTTSGVIIGHAFHLDYMSTDPTKDKRKDGTAFDSITGVVTYSFGHYRVNPRTADDLKEATP